MSVEWLVLLCVCIYCPLVHDVMFMHRAEHRAHEQQMTKNNALCAEELVCASPSTSLSHQYKQQHLLSLVACLPACQRQVNATTALESCVDVGVFVCVCVS